MLGYTLCASRANRSVLRALNVGLMVGLRVLLKGGIAGNKKGA